GRAYPRATDLLIMADCGGSNGYRARLLRIPAKLNAQSDHCERGFRASRSLIGAKRRRQ
ncbi:MAG: hypothetical protein HYZ58_17325, partial [Acidobacteria bacterium]|nr:hypothetical protein [Acidobacteriota bacterium]